MEPACCMQICGGRNERICILRPTIRFTWRMRDISWQRPLVCNEISRSPCQRFPFQKYYFTINVVWVGEWLCLCVCVALLWQSMHINMSVLFTCLLLLLPSPSEFSYLSSIYARAYAAWPHLLLLPSRPFSLPTHTHTRALAPTHIHPHSEHFTCREQFLLHTSMGAQFFHAVLFFCYCVTSGNNWILLGIFIHIYLRTKYIYI